MLGANATNLHIDEAVLDHMLFSPSGDVGMWLRRKGAEMEAAARLEVGKRSGKLERSIYRTQERIPGGHKMVLGADARDSSGLKSYALYHHEGTRPHEIVRREGMAFVGRTGQPIVVKVVHHRGSKGNKFLSRQLRLLGIPGV
jgi:hypothetical protein